MWSYSGNPAASALDEVRFLVGDTDATKKMLQDEEILYNLALVSGPTPPISGNFLAAAYCADQLAGASSRLNASKSVGDLSISYGQQVTNFQSLAASLRRRATLRMVPVYAGGLSLSEKAANYADGDLTKAAIRIDGMNNPSGNLTDATKGP